MLSEIRDAIEVHPETGCWIWQRGKTGRGYGVIRVEGKPTYAHRLTFEAVNGEIPAGLDLDHLCRNHPCCNPEHLEAVSRRENVLRGEGPALLAQLNGAKTHCKHGHPFDAENTYRRPSGGRACRTCQRLRRRKREER